MSKLLEDLYNGKIIPAERRYPTMEECEKIRDKYHEHYEDFIQKIGKSFQLELNNILDEHADLISTSNKNNLEYAFADGFRLGAMLMLEILEGE